ncbi:MAG: ABC transporter permease, partial [Saccharothrix sp.]|nr:ABC transporter permease [Saccharothrix sp.]
GVAASTVLGVAVVAGLFALWDSTLPLGWDVLGYLTLVGVAFALVQGALLRLFGIRAMAVLGPLYLIAPAVAGQVPELLDPAYRALLWSWTPFRFSVEGLRALLHGGSPSPAQVWVFVALAAIGLAVVALLPGQEGQPDLADGVVDVRVDEADRLPGAQRQHTA